MYETKYIHKTKEEVMKSLQEIADELGKPIKEVGVEWSKRGHTCSNELFDEVLVPIFFPPEECIHPSRRKAINGVVQGLDDTARPCLIFTDIEETKKELQAVAKELELPFEHELVYVTWNRRGNIVSDEVHDKFVQPIYFPNGD